MAAHPSSNQINVDDSSAASAASVAVGSATTFEVPLPEWMKPGAYADGVDVAWSDPVVFETTALGQFQHPIVEAEYLREVHDALPPLLPPAISGLLVLWCAVFWFGAADLPVAAVGVLGTALAVATIMASVSGAIRLWPAAAAFLAKQQLGGGGGDDDDEDTDDDELVPSTLPTAAPVPFRPERARFSNATETSSVVGSAAPPRRRRSSWERDDWSMAQRFWLGAATETGLVLSLATCSVVLVFGGVRWRNLVGTNASTTEDARRWMVMKPDAMFVPLELRLRCVNALPAGLAILALVPVLAGVPRVFLALPLYLFVVVAYPLYSKWGVSTPDSLLTTAQGTATPVSPFRTSSASDNAQRYTVLVLVHVACAVFVVLWERFRRNAFAAVRLEAANGVAAAEETRQYRAWIAPKVGQAVARRVMNPAPREDVAECATVVVVRIDEYLAWSLLPSCAHIDALRGVVSLFSAIAELKVEGVHVLMHCGDTVMAASNLVTRCPTHPLRAVLFGMQAMRLLASSNSLFFTTTATPLQLCAAVHSGRLVGAVVGSSLRHYVLFGPAIEGATAIATRCIPGAVAVSSYTRRLIREAGLAEMSDGLAKSGGQPSATGGTGFRRSASNFAVSNPPTVGGSASNSRANSTFGNGSALGLGLQATPPVLAGGTHLTTIPTVTSNVSTGNAGTLLSGSTNSTTNSLHVQSPNAAASNGVGSKMAVIPTQAGEDPPTVLVAGSSGRGVAAPAVFTKSNSLSSGAMPPSPRSFATATVRTTTPPTGTSIPVTSTQFLQSVHSGNSPSSVGSYLPPRPPAGGGNGGAPTPIMMLERHSSLSVDSDTHPPIFGFAGNEPELEPDDPRRCTSVGVSDENRPMEPLHVTGSKLESSAAAMSNAALSGLGGTGTSALSAQATQSYNGALGQLRALEASLPFAVVDEVSVGDSDQHSATGSPVHGVPRFTYLSDAGSATDAAAVQIAASGAPVETRTELSAPSRRTTWARAEYDFSGLSASVLGYGLVASADGESTRAAADAEWLESAFFEPWTMGEAATAVKRRPSHVLPSVALWLPNNSSAGSPLLLAGSPIITGPSSVVAVTPPTTPPPARSETPPQQQGQGQQANAQPAAPPNNGFPDGVTIPEEPNARTDRLVAFWRFVRAEVGWGLPAAVSCGLVTALALLILFLFDDHPHPSHRGVRCPALWLFVAAAGVSAATTLVVTLGDRCRGDQEFPLDHALRHRPSGLVVIIGAASVLLLAGAATSRPSVLGNELGYLIVLVTVVLLGVVPLLPVSFLTGILAHALAVLTPYVVSSFLSDGAPFVDEFVWTIVLSLVGFPVAYRHWRRLTAAAFVAASEVAARADSIQEQKLALADSLRVALPGPVADAVAGLPPGEQMLISQVPQCCCLEVRFRAVPHSPTASGAGSAVGSNGRRRRSYNGAGGGTGSLAVNPLTGRDSNGYPLSRAASNASSWLPSDARAVRYRQGVQAVIERAAMRALDANFVVVRLRGDDVTAAGPLVPSGNADAAFVEALAFLYHLRGRDVQCAALSVGPVHLAVSAPSRVSFDVGGPAAVESRALVGVACDSVNAVVATDAARQRRADIAAEVAAGRVVLPDPTAFSGTRLMEDPLRWSVPGLGPTVVFAVEIDSTERDLFTSASYNSLV